MIEAARIVFLDFDGVVKESVKVKTEAFRRLFEQYGDDVAEKVVQHHMAHGGLSRYKKIPLYLDWAGVQSSEELVGSFCRDFASIVEDAVVDSDWVPGVRAFLGSQVRKRSFVLVTATPQEEIESIVHRLSLTSCFDSIFGAPVSKAAALAHTLKTQRVDPSDAVMIGDSREDYLAARECRVPFILRRTSENEMSMPDYGGLTLIDFE